TSVGCRSICPRRQYECPLPRSKDTHPMANSFGSQSTLKVGDRSYTIHRLDAVYKSLPDTARLPYSLKILLENLLRTENDLSVTAADIQALAKWDPIAEPSREVAFSPSRVLLPASTGVPCVMDLGAMRDRPTRRGGD